MALTDRQIALYTDLLYKKVAAGVSTSNPDTPYFEQPIAGRSFVDLKQIWAQSDQIPDTAQEIQGVVAYISVLSLTPINGFPLSYWFGTHKKIIPFNYGDGTSYNYVLQTNSGDPIFAGANEWYLDPDTGVLTFVDGNPPGVDPSNPPKISCYEYIGKTAADTGIGGGSGTSNSIGEWQDSVLGFSDSLNNSGTSGMMFDIYKDVNLTQLVAQVPLSNGLRIIHIGNTVPSVPIYDIDNDTVTYLDVENNDILTYWDATENNTNNSGWVLFRPTTGTFTSIDYNLNSIIRFTGTEWITQSFEKTVPTEIELIPENNLPEINDWQILTNTKIPEIPSVKDTELYVNNINTIDIDPKRAYAFGTVTTTDVSSQITPDTQVSFKSAPGIFYLGQMLKITTPAYGFVNIIKINYDSVNNVDTVIVSSNTGATITGVSTLDTVNIADNILDAISNANNILNDVIMFWHSVNAGYQIENDDSLIFKFNITDV